jgi:signal transduction histidine kinase
MPARDWVRPPRQMLLIFFVVALVSTVTLSWLVWELVVLEREAADRRQLEEFERAADTATAGLDRHLTALDRRLDPDAPVGADEALPAGAALVRSRLGAMTVTPPGRVPYFPQPAAPAAVSDVRLQIATRLELVDRDLAGATRAYAALADDADPAVRGVALTRLARTQRKQRAWSTALATYDTLGGLANTGVEGLPALLVARVGRISVFEAQRDGEAFRAEASLLKEDLARGRLHLTRSQYAFYAAEVARSLGVPHSIDAEALARADALTWVWEHVAAHPGSDRRLVSTGAGSTLVSWRPGPSPGEFSALIMGPDAIRSLVAEIVPRGLAWSVTSPEGSSAVGAPPPARDAAIRLAAATGLPWTLHVFSSESNPAIASPRQALLVSVLATVAVLVAAGWYFIWRGISREVRVSRLQSDFVAAVSHEFRSPLTSLRHIAELLATDRIGSDERRQRSYGLLVNETNRLGRLVEGLLDFGRLEDGHATFQFEEGNPSELVRDVVRDFERRLDPGAHRVELRAADEVPTVRVDREAFGRALWNLLDNAVKYSPRAGRVEVSVVADPAADRVAIAVRDEGLGIPADEQVHVFDRFVRGAEAKAQRIGGAGIGLAMAREIVRAHGGEITVSSQIGHGSVFTIALPVLGR